MRRRLCGENFSGLPWPHTVSHSARVRLLIGGVVLFLTRAVYEQFAHSFGQALDYSRDDLQKDRHGGTLPRTDPILKRLMDRRPSLPGSGVSTGPTAGVAVLVIGPVEIRVRQSV